MGSGWFDSRDTSALNLVLIGDEALKPITRRIDQIDQIDHDPDHLDPSLPL